MVVIDAKQQRRKQPKTTGLEEFIPSTTRQELFPGGGNRPILQQLGRGASLLLVMVPYFLWCPKVGNLSPLIMGSVKDGGCMSNSGCLSKNTTPFSSEP